MALTEPAVEVTHLRKMYGYNVALNDVSLSVSLGEVRGLLGPNGSGKSTLMKTLVGLLKPSAGFARVLGLDVDRDSMMVKRAVGYVPETPRLYEFLTAAEYLDFIADVRGLGFQEKSQRIKRFLGALDLEGKEGDMISSYSQGMKQKVAIMAALLHHPKILLLDEPLNGLDPKSARVVKELIHELSREGVSTIFSTHVLEIAEAICDRITILQHGIILAEGTSQELREKAGLPGSGLEDVFLKLTGTRDVQDIVEALLR
ncbi:ABC transporter ATP-binding protein [Candidatus Bathyarchaeota archaeon]|nr:MAG: ABC transporter ATP-binding protein [Candidatus Bathyarchaeota archaeon]TMI32783.1 MAG: ABC transporter ATP-binding protein [Candidatus Bathyarchaeota archaeon]